MGDEDSLKFVAAGFMVSKPSGNIDESRFLPSIPVSRLLHHAQKDGVLRSRGRMLQAFHLLAAYKVHDSVNPRLPGPHL